MSDKLVYTNPIDPFNLYIKLAAMAGLFLASPYVLWQIWLFISPGLYRHEKKYVWPFVMIDQRLVHWGRVFCVQAGLSAGFAIPAGVWQQVSTDGDDQRIFQYCDDHYYRRGPGV